MDMKTKNLTIAAEPLQHTNVSSSRIRIVQNFALIWFDGNIDGTYSSNNRNSINKLRQVVNTVNTFSDIDECIDFTTDMKEEKVFMIFSGALGQTLVPIAHDILQISKIYIFCENKSQHEQWMQQWSKVQGAFTDINSICELLKQAAQSCDKNSVSMSFIPPSDGTTNQNLDQLDQSFMYTQILKEILLTIDFEPQHINEFFNYYREQAVGNNAELKNVDKLEKEYHHRQPIWWYTYNYFLYSMLNRALRTMEVDLIIKMGFFVQDLHKHITQLHHEQYIARRKSVAFTVYRGQGLSKKDFDQLMKTKGGLLSFNNFLSTSLDRAVSLAFAESNQDDPTLIGVLFEITVIPSISSSSFADIREVSSQQDEEEILFSMHSVFRIGQIKQIGNSNRLWQIDLTITSDNDPQLYTLTECIREETGPTGPGWLRLGVLLMKLGHYDKAQQVCEIMLGQKISNQKEGEIYQMLAMIKKNQGNYTEAITFCEKSIMIQQNILPISCNLAHPYGTIATVYLQLGDYSKALTNHENSLEIRQKTLPADHPDLSISYNNISSVYVELGKYSTALSYYEKSLEIKQKNVPSNHPDLALCYMTLGTMHSNMGEYSKSLLYFEKAIDIQQKTLPPNHPRLADSYNNIGFVFYKKSENSKALLYYEKCLDIQKKILSPNHPSLSTTYNNIALVYGITNQHAKALSFFEKSLEISQKTLPSNHPDLALSYSNIGCLYIEQAEYSKALSYLKTALEIYQRSLSPNDPHLGYVHNSFGMAYMGLMEYSKALPHLEKVIEICQKTLPPTHPDMAIFYENLGLVYATQDQPAKGLALAEKARDILQRSVPANHPRLISVQKMIEMIKGLSE